jgi:hypothetical protein
MVEAASHVVQHLSSLLHIARACNNSLTNRFTSIACSQVDVLCDVVTSMGNTGSRTLAVPVRYANVP